MAINSIPFFAFAAVVLLLYYALPKNLRLVLLIVASFIFCATWDIRFALLLASAIIINYFLGRLIATELHLSRRLLILGITFNVIMLVVGKYVGLFNLPGLKQIVVPIGISYYTFQSISYLIDVYLSRMRAVKRLDLFAAYLAYFPKLVAGPIERANKFIPLLEAPHKVTSDEVRQAVWLILLGLVRSIVFANWLVSPYVKLLQQQGNRPAITIAAVIGYAVYLYMDFSGYVNIVRGISTLFGIPLSVNFRQPYFATSITDFWNRWHITLSAWLRDYIYFPLTRWMLSQTQQRFQLVARVVPPIVTMVICGLWHGATVPFLLWGLLHGVYLAIENISGIARRLTQQRAILKIAAIPIVFAIVALTWQLFALSGFAAAGLPELDLSGTAHEANILLFKAVIILIALILFDLPGYIADDELVFARWPALPRAMIFGSLCTAIVFASSSALVPFVYRGF
jgi:alginate O-acetyltransferase complex protein AlgI